MLDGVDAVDEVDGMDGVDGGGIGRFTPAPLGEGTGETGTPRETT